MGLLDQLQAYIQANTPRSTRPVANPLTVINQGLINPNKFNAPNANRFKDSAFGLLGGIPGADAPVGFTQGADLWNRGEKGAAALSIAGGLLPFVPPTLGGLYAMHKVADKIGTPLPGGKAKSQAGMIVYHGSPHKFDKFDMSKIGTGEGAQAYGHGLYFTESPGVAKTYQGFYKNPHANMALINMQDRNKAIAGLHDDISRIKSGNEPQNLDVFGDLMFIIGGVDDKINSIKDAIKELETTDVGSFYKVDIPDEAIPRMLDWDKPLSEQPALIAAVQAKHPGYMSAGAPNGDVGGADAYLRLTESMGQQGATDYLKQQGIPGIRYLDGSSRTAGQGTYNYVLFDDQMPRILEVNGQPTGLLSYADEAAKKAKKAKK